MLYQIRTNYVHLVCFELTHFKERKIIILVRI